LIFSDTMNVLIISDLSNFVIIVVDVNNVQCSVFNGWLIRCFDEYLVEQEIKKKSTQGDVGHWSAIKGYISPITRKGERRKQ
jgi:hypothetical protein